MPARGGSMSGDLFGDMIYLYSRADAIRDGVLIEADPQLCREAGILWPVAISDHLWGFVDPGYLGEMHGQSITGRLWDLLFLFRVAAKRSATGKDRLTYRADFQMRVADQERRETVTVIAVCGPGDDGEPVITLMLPEDD